jgi:hypothetical protein
MTYSLSIEAWTANDSSCFYNFYNWFISAVNTGEFKHLNLIHSVLLVDYDAEIAYYESVPCLIFKSQDALTEFVLRWS